MFLFYLKYKVQTDSIMAVIQLKLPVSVTVS